MKLYNKNIAMLMAGLLTLSSGALVTSCDEDDDYSTSQFGGGQVKLVASSLQVTRGAYMTFKGNNLNQVSSIEFTGGVSSAPEVVDENTIRCLVPEGAAAGPVTLIYNGGEITTAAISFTEPITFDGYVAADTVKAGDKITIKGTYLNYIEFVRFATGDDVEVINAPTPPQITEFNVTVPVDASTGKIAIGYYSVVNGDTAEVLLENLKPLTVAEPSNLKLASKSVKAGDNVVITGSLLRLVESVSFAGNVTVASGIEDPTADVEKLTLELPAEAQDGDVVLNLLSGLSITVDQLATVLPTEVAIKEPKESYGIGDVVVISGNDLDLIVASAFTNGADTLIYENGELKLPVSAAAQSGDITLKLANGATVPVSGFVTTKPEFEFPTEATPIDVLEIASTLPERVASIFFGTIEVKASVLSDKSGFSVQVPLLAESGCAVTLLMDNGEKVDVAESFTVNGYTFCAFKDAAAFVEQTPTVGTLASGIVVNGANLDNVLLNGKDTKFLLTGEMLYVYVGAQTGKQIVTLVSDGTKVDYEINVVASGVVETVVWTGPLEITWNDGGRVVVRASDLEGVPAGSVLRLYFNGKGEWAQAQLCDGKWSTELLGTFKPSEHDEFNWWNGGSTEEHVYEITLTADVLAHLRENAAEFGDIPDAALIIQGEKLIFSKVSVVVDYSAPESIILSSGSDAGGWTLPVSLSWSDGGRLVVYKNNPVDLSSKVKVGATLYIVTSERHGQCQINDNGWTSIGTVADWNNNGEFTYEIPITQAYVDAFNKEGDMWLILQGDNGFTITDMYIK